jgi:AraC-like DNA-binding protein
VVDDRGSGHTALVRLLSATEEVLGRRSGDVVATHLHDDLLLLAHRRPTMLKADLYDPVVCLIVRGRKETGVVDRTLEIGPGQFLVVSHDTPVTSRIVEADPQAPYVALVLSLDMAILSTMREELGPDALPRLSSSSLQVGRADERLVDAFTRYVRLSGSARDTAVLGPLLVREIHYLLLTTSGGEMLRRLARQDGQVSSIARAIRMIRSDVSARLVVPELAGAVGLSPSAFHRHFKMVTGTSPLQYQKEMRLLEARRLLTTEGRTVMQSAVSVGYESHSQFSREYARKFGAPPAVDRRRTPSQA